MFHNQSHCHKLSIVDVIGNANNRLTETSSRPTKSDIKSNNWKWMGLNGGYSYSWLLKSALQDFSDRKYVKKNRLQCPVFTKLFRIRINIRLKLKILLLWPFFNTYYNYLTIDSCFLIKYVLQTRLFGILSFFMKENVIFRVATVMKSWAH